MMAKEDKTSHLLKGNLPEFHTVDGMDEMVSWLRSSSPEDIAFWSDQVLRDNWQVSPPLLRQLEPEEVLISVVRGATIDIRNKVGDGLKLLTQTLQWDNINPERFNYFAELLSIIGYLRVEQLHDLLTRMALSEKLKYVTNENGVHLHRFVLASLGAFACNDQMAQIYERDIQEIEYAGLSYRMLWRYKPEYALKYAPLMRQMGAQDERFPLIPLLNEASKLGLNL